MKLKTVFTCYIIDGTAGSARPELAGVALTKEDAEAWVAASNDSWQSRRYWEIQVIGTGEVSDEG